MTLTEAAFRADLVRTGLNQVGHLYRDSSVPTNWPPDQFDCSVFVNWLNHKHGIDLDLGAMINGDWPEPEPNPWHKFRGYTGNQKAAAERLGATVHFSERKPGDRLYYDHPSSGQKHVTLYIGDNKVVHAAGTAYGVIVSPVVPPGVYGHGGKRLVMTVSATKFARACGMEFTKNPTGTHVVKIGGRTPLSRLNIKNQSRMSWDYFNRKNPHIGPGFHNPGTPVVVPMHVEAIFAGNRPNS